MNQANIARLMTFAQHGQPKDYGGSDMMRADLEAVLRSLGPQPISAPVPPADTLQPNAPRDDRDPHFGGHSYDASLLRELLAVIHADGGHYVAEHGIEKAAQDAAEKYLALSDTAPTPSGAPAVQEGGAP